MVFDADDMEHLVDASLDFWLTTGRFADQFEREFPLFVGVRECSLVNSGSSANLVALSALTSPQLKERRLLPGDEVITVAAGFPTTLNPIIQNGLIPVFLDVKVPAYNIDVARLEEAVGPRTRAIMIAHTLGNPFDLDAVTSLAKRHNLWFVEDCCDAVGATYKGRKVGTFGDLATVSFYPAHHITMGEGGAVLTNSPKLRDIVESFRDWGRDCWCAPGMQNTCGTRFESQFGQLPRGFDHKYTYSHIGYNLKLTDLQAAVGVAQLKKLPAYIAKRRENFASLHSLLQDCQDRIVLPEWLPESEPSWFGYPITVRDSSPVDRNAVVQYLESKHVATRLLFGGNLLRQPAYEGVKHRVVGALDQSDWVMRGTFWVGVYPALDSARIEYIASTLKAALAGAAA
jgi:CDP-6-deoxy-D-xylo-4-hexulose-3-dehydrase